MATRHAPARARVAMKSRGLEGTNGKPATPARAPAAPKAPPELPAGACYACGGTRYWLTPGDAYECRTCHPEPARLRAEWEAGHNGKVT